MLNIFKFLCISHLCVCVSARTCTMALCGGQSLVELALFHFRLFLGTASQEARLADLSYQLNF